MNGMLTGQVSRAPRNASILRSVCGGPGDLGQWRRGQRGRALPEVRDYSEKSKQAIFSGVKERIIRPGSEQNAVGGDRTMSVMRHPTRLSNQRCLFLDTLQTREPGMLKEDSVRARKFSAKKWISKGSGPPIYTFYKWVIDARILVRRRVGIACEKLKYDAFSVVFVVQTCKKRAKRSAGVSSWAGSRVSPYARVFRVVEELGCIGIAVKREWEMSQKVRIDELRERVNEIGDNKNSWRPKTCACPRNNVNSGM
ncbi:hypothetical protein BD779DRAFT_1476597 [Infundibulicybe gibba]|nr:hypothetical protein BD779DRAFT_1476597 [Infundibulicybe gibba]